MPTGRGSPKRTTTRRAPGCGGSAAGTCSVTRRPGRLPGTSRAAGSGRCGRSPSTLPGCATTPSRSGPGPSETLPASPGSPEPGFRAGPGATAAPGSLVRRQPWSPGSPPDPESAAVDGEDLGRPTVGEITHGPDVADGRGRNAGERAAGAGAGAGLLFPGGAVPARDQRVDDGTGGVSAHRPGGAGRGGGHTEQGGTCSRAGAGHLFPCGAVPARDEGLLAAACVVGAHRPRVAGRGCGRPV